FWYFAVLQALPSARQSLSLGEAIFLNVRGLYFPAPVFNEGSGVVIAAFVIGLIATISISIWARNKQRLTGQQTPMGRIGLGLLVGLPLLVYFVSGMPISLEYPELKGFNFKGGISIIPELAALLLALSVYTAAF
ncbi:amino acid ABC transporter permease, partial [Vibrio alginolyticus]|nr:amino acid ABC transporter permease [Vibrio alginolyticus]